MSKYYTIYNNGKPKPMPKKVKLGQKYFDVDKKEWKDTQKQELLEYRYAKKYNIRIK